MKDKLSFEELCKLIEVCNNSNVSLIRVGEVELTFKSEYLQKEGPRIEVTSSKIASVPAPEFLEEVDPAVLQQLEADIKQAQLDQMMINDPVQFEELINCGDFVNGSE